MSEDLKALQARVQEQSNRIKALEDLVQAINRCFIAAPEKPQAKPQPKPEGANFSPEILEYCTVNGNTVKPKAYIHDSTVWAELNEELKQMGFKWVSDGKNSRWSK